MRNFLLILFLFASTLGYAQRKRCSFSYKSIKRPDSVYTQKLVAAIDTLPLKTNYRIEEIPDFILKTLDCWISDDWTIANPGGPFYEADAIGPEPLPSRQLLYMGLNDEYMLIAYVKGGFMLNCPIMLFRFENEKIDSVMYWISNTKEIKTKADVMRFLQRYPKKRPGKIPII